MATSAAPAPAPAPVDSRTRVAPTTIARAGADDSSVALPRAGTRATPKAARTNPLRTTTTAGATVVASSSSTSSSLWEAGSERTLVGSAGPVGGATGDAQRGEATCDANSRGSNSSDGGGGGGGGDAGGGGAGECAGAKMEAAVERPAATAVNPYTDRVMEFAMFAGTAHGALTQYCDSTLVCRTGHGRRVAVALSFMDTDADDREPRLLSLRELSSYGDEIVITIADGGRSSRATYRLRPTTRSDYFVSLVFRIDAPYFRAPLVAARIEFLYNSRLSVIHLVEPARHAVARRRRGSPPTATSWVAPVARPRHVGYAPRRRHAGDEKEQQQEEEEEEDDHDDEEEEKGGRGGPPPPPSLVRKKARSEKPSRVCDGTDDEARDGHVDVRRPYRGRRANNNNNNNNNNAGNYSGFRARSRTRATRADGGDGGERAVADAGEEEEGDTVNGHYKNTGRGGAERSDSETGRVRTRRRGRERVDDVVRGREGAGEGTAEEEEDEEEREGSSGSGGNGGSGGDDVRARTSRTTTGAEHPASGGRGGRDAGGGGGGGGGSQEAEGPVAGVHKTTRVYKCGDCGKSKLRTPPSHKHECDPQDKVDYQNSVFYTPKKKKPRKRPPRAQPEPDPSPSTSPATVDLPCDPPPSSTVSAKPASARKVRPPVAASSPLLSMPSIQPIPPAPVPPPPPPPPPGPVAPPAPLAVLSSGLAPAHIQRRSTQAPPASRTLPPVLAAAVARPSAYPT